MTSDNSAQATQLDQIIDAFPLNDLEVDELFDVVDTLQAQFVLRRSLSDPNLDGEQRGLLVRQLFTSKLSATTVDLIAQLVGLVWANGWELARGLEQVAVRIVFRRANEQGRVDDVREELFRFARTVSATPQLRDSISNADLENDVRQQLVSDLLDGRVAPETLILARRGIFGRERTYEQSIRRFLDIAAQMRGHVVAKVQVGCALTEEQTDKLRAQLARIYGVTVDLEIEILPDVVGGVRVEIADEIIDGTISTRLDEAKRRIS